MLPAARPELYDTYWKFAAERQAIFHRRLGGQSPPWTTDPVLQKFKFCNAYRASDRVSQFLIRNVIYSPFSAALPPEDVFLRIVLFRLFSRESTWTVLEESTGGVRFKTLNIGRLSSILDRLRAVQPIYTSAFILSPHAAYGHRSKHENHLELVREMFRPGALGLKLAQADNLRGIYDALLEWPLIGPFLAYQIAIDLNYSDHFDFSENDFTMPGPGAQRGLKKVFGDFEQRLAAGIIMEMVERQHHEFDRLGIQFLDLFGRSLHAIDCQGLFCEVDKYSRVAFPDLKSNRVRIKQLYRISDQPVRLFFPPKWGLNSRLPGPDDSQLRQEVAKPPRQTVLFA